MTRAFTLFGAKRSSPADPGRSRITRILVSADSSWHRRLAPSTAAAASPTNGGSIVFGGGDTTASLDDTWLFRYEALDAADEVCDSGVDGDGDGLVGCADPDCAAVCAP